MPTALELKPEEWRKYNPAKNAGIRRSGKESELKDYRAEAIKTARQAATLLRQRFGAEKVVVFGSLASKDDFTLWSDIDIAAWGIDSDKFYMAVAVVTGLSSLFKIDLVEPDTCRESIRTAIIEQGIEI